MVVSTGSLQTPQVNSTFSLIVPGVSVRAGVVLRDAVTLCAGVKAD